MKKLKYALSLAAIALTLSGCGQSNAQTKHTPPALTIDVANVEVQSVQSWHTFTTRLQAPQRVTLKPRVSGQIEHVTFKEGSLVNQGDLLFQLDSRPFVAEVEKLEAQLESAKALLAQAKQEAERAERLIVKKAISTEEADQRQATLMQSIAGKNAIAAALESAKLDLAFSQIEAPITGVVSRALITEGNFVTAGQSGLTTLVSNQKVYAYFDIDERTWNNSFAGIRAEDKVKVSLEKLNNQGTVPGYVDFIDNEIDPTTGTLKVRAVFEAQKYQLKPGAFARVSINANDAQELAIVPERSIGTDLKNRFVLIVDDNNQLQYRLVKLGERYGAYRAIISGLQQGERIASNGPARVGPGMPITPNMVELDFNTTQFVLNPDQPANSLLSSVN